MSDIDQKTLDRLREACALYEQHGQWVTLMYPEDILALLDRLAEAEAHIPTATGERWRQAYGEEQETAAALRARVAELEEERWFLSPIPTEGAAGVTWAEECRDVKLQLEQAEDRVAELEAENRDLDQRVLSNGERRVLLDVTKREKDRAEQAEARIEKAERALAHTRQNASAEAQESRTCRSVLEDVADALGIPCVDWDGSIPREASALRARVAELERERDEARESDAESVRMYHSARDRADAYQARIAELEQHAEDWNEAKWDEHCTRRHANEAALRARVAELEASVEACSARNESDADVIAALRARVADMRAALERVKKRADEGDPPNGCWEDPTTAERVWKATLDDYDMAKVDAALAAARGEYAPEGGDHD